MNILIYGGGAVGLGIASCLLKAGIKTDIITRQETITNLKKHGLLRTGIFGDYKADPADFDCFAEIENSSFNNYTHVLVCTKSFDTENAAKNIYENRIRLTDNSVIILFQNGWGNAEIFCKSFPENRVYNARVITGFIRPEPNHVKVTVHADSVHIGSLFGHDAQFLEELSSSISSGGLPCEITETVEKDLWAKMLYNCALNPLGAVLKVPYGKLGEKNESREIMESIIKEIYVVMKKAGYSTYKETAEEYSELFYNKLLPPTAEHESSMLQDLRAGKRTEIDGLCGAVLKLAEKYNIEVPYNRIIFNLIKSME
jgi:2-dehydropantoate 2-reductase